MDARGVPAGITIGAGVKITPNPDGSFTVFPVAAACPTPRPGPPPPPPGGRGPPPPPPPARDHAPRTGGPFRCEARGRHWSIARKGVKTEKALAAHLSEHPGSREAERMRERWQKRGRRRSPP